MKRTFSLILSLLMVFAMFTGLNVAAENVIEGSDSGESIPQSNEQTQTSDLAETGATSYKLWLGSTQVTSENKNDILKDGGKAKYDPATQTLTLNNPTFNSSISSSDINLTLKGSYQMKTTSDLPNMAVHVTGGNLTLDGDFLLLGLRYGIFASKDVTIKSGTLDVQEGLVNDFKDNNVAGFFGLHAGGILRIKDDVECVSAYAASNSWGAPIGAYFMEISDKLTITDPQDGYMDSYSLKMNDYNIFTGYTVYDKYGNVPSHITIKKPDFQWAYDVWVGGKRVTGVNKKDIFGDGKASFDSTTNTLTLNEPNLTIDPNVYASRISSQNIDLTVKGAYHTDAASSRFGINIENGNLTLQGDFSFAGKTDAVKTGGTLYILSGTLTAKGGTRGITAGKTVSIGSRAERVEAQGTDRAISASSISVSEYMGLITPKNGFVSRGSVYDSSGAVAKQAVFGKVSTVSFDPNGGSGTMDSVKVERGGSYTLPSCTFTAPAGKVFKQWRIGRTGYYKPGESITVNSNTTVYAVWEDAVFINSVALTITEPKAGARPDFTVKKNNNNCDFYIGLGFFCPNGTGLEFVDKTIEDSTNLTQYMSKDSVFKAGQKYTARVFLSTMDRTNTFFAENFTATINGRPATLISDTSSGKETLVYVEYEFTVPSSGSSLIRGDADVDDDVTILDATAIQRHIADLPAKSFNEIAADADNDKEVTILDATAIQRYIAGLPTYASIGKPIT